MTMRNDEKAVQLLRSFENNNFDLENVIIESNYYNLDQIGKLICALANYSAFLDNSYYYAYAIWGIQGNSIIGTDISIPRTEELLINASFNMYEIVYKEKRCIVLEVHRTGRTPMQYKGVEYSIKNGKVVSLEDYPEDQHNLWTKLSSYNTYETRIAKDNLSLREVVASLYWKPFFSYDQNITHSGVEIVDKLVNYRCIVEKNTGKYAITNLGALLLAKDILMFDSVKNKAVRVLVYDGNDYTCPANEVIGRRGYIVGFEGLIKYIIDKTPTHEEIGIALRKSVKDYPTIIIRELVANALIHQDLNKNGGPIISIFNNRIEITNPGTPLIDYKRFIDEPPYSRNEALASAMHKVGICEERGSGYDKIIRSAEENNMPVPTIAVTNNSTKVIIYPKKVFDDMSRQERINACYAHVCLKYVNGEKANNATLRERFKLDETERYKLSRVFSETVEAGLIKQEEGTGIKNRAYIPYWL